jgi:hypothetical protein
VATTDPIESKNLPVLVHPTELVLRGGAFQRGGPVEPRPGLGIIDCHTNAILKVEADVIHGPRVAMFRGFVIPGKGLVETLRLTPTFLRHQAELKGPLMAGSYCARKMNISQEMAPMACFFEDKGESLDSPIPAGGRGLQRVASTRWRPDVGPQSLDGQFETFDRRRRTPVSCHSRRAIN